jgi:hypothetical protein
VRELCGRAMLKLVRGANETLQRQVNARHGFRGKNLKKPTPSSLPDLRTPRIAESMTCSDSLALCSVS